MIVDSELLHSTFNLIIIIECLGSLMPVPSVPYCLICREIIHNHLLGVQILSEQQVAVKWEPESSSLSSLHCPSLSFCPLICQMTSHSVLMTSHSVLITSLVPGSHHMCWNCCRGNSMLVIVLSRSYCCCMCGRHLSFSVISGHSSLRSLFPVFKVF